MPAPKVLFLYAVVSGVYLLYLPHAFPVLDDWMYLQLFDQARTGDLHTQLSFLRSLIDNTWLQQFRIFWTSLVPVFAVSFFAGFTAWIYFLLAWASHLLTAFLLCRIVSLLSGDAATGFTAGALYAVFPAANNALFWPVSNCIYYLQSLCLLWWFYTAWKKRILAGDCRYGWKDLALLFPVLFSGEQILPALALLLPVAYWVFGKPPSRRPFLRFWFIHLAVMAALLAVYAFAVNAMPIARGFQNRYSGGSRWSWYPFVARLLAAVGWNPRLAEWTPAWRPDAILLAFLALAGLACFWGIRSLQRSGPESPRHVKLLLWSVAGTLLTYLPVALLPGVEWRYLYVPAAFLVSGAVALLGLLKRPARVALALVAVAYALALTYFEMRQCWIPQRREAQAIVEAVSAAGTVAPGDVFVFSRAPYSIGAAPSFIAGSSWSLKAMLEHYTQTQGVQGAREVLINERGELALYNRDRIGPLSRQNLPRLRVFVRDAGGRFVPKSLVALPAPAERFELVPLRRNEKAAVPPETLTLEQLRTLPESGEIYYPHPFKGPLPHA